jgi:hypothetical protein
MAIVAGFDVHRAQIIFDALDTGSGAEAVSRDCMAVPDHLASAVAGWLICYAQAGSAGRR